MTTLPAYDSVMLAFGLPTQCRDEFARLFAGIPSPRNPAIEGALLADEVYVLERATDSASVTEPGFPIRQDDEE